MRTIILFVIKIALTIGMYQFGWADETLIQTILTYLFLYGFISVLVNLVTAIGIIPAIAVLIGSIAVTDYIITNETAQMIIGGGIIIMNLLYDIYCLATTVMELLAITGCIKNDDF